MTVITLSTNNKTCMSYIEMFSMHDMVNILTPDLSQSRNVLYDPIAKTDPVKKKK